MLMSAVWLSFVAAAVAHAGHHHRHHRSVYECEDNGAGIGDTGQDEGEGDQHIGMQQAIIIQR